MNRHRFMPLLAVTLMLVAAPLMAQQKRVSPPDIAGSVIDNNRVTVFYSRPFTKDPMTGNPRKIWGGLVPYSKVWRAGANEATLLVIQQPITMGTLTVPAGAYTLFAMPEEDGGKLIVSKQIGQWGTQYDEKQDLGRVTMKKESLKDAVDQFTMAVEKNPTGGGIIKLMWDTTQYSTPFTVKK